MPLTAGDSTQLATSPSDASTISSSSSSSDSNSIQTFPSLSTLHTSISSQNAPTLTAPSSLNYSQNALPSTQNVPALALFSNILYSFSTSSVAVHDLIDLRQLLSLPPLSSAGAVKSAVISPNAATLFTAHQDGKIRAWSRSSPKFRLLTSLPTLSDRLRRLALPSNYVTIRRHRRRLWIEHADAVSALAVNGDLLYSVSWDKTLKIWRISDLKCLETLTAHDDSVNAVAVGVDGTVYTGSADRRIRVWAKGSSHRRHVLVTTLVRHKSAVNALAVSSDGNVLYSGANDRSVLVWEREESANFMNCSGALRGHVRAVMCLSTVGIDLVVSGSMDRTVRLWRRGSIGEGYSCLWVMKGHVTGVRSVVAAMSNDGEEEGFRVCTSSLDGEVRVWRLQIDANVSNTKKN